MLQERGKQNVEIEKLGKKSTFINILAHWCKIIISGSETPKLNQHLPYLVTAIASSRKNWSTGNVRPRKKGIKLESLRILAQLSQNR